MTLFSLEETVETGRGSNFLTVDAYEVLSHDEMKATEQFFSEVPFHTLHKVVPDFADSVDET